MEFRSSQIDGASFIALQKTAVNYCFEIILPGCRVMEAGALGGIVKEKG